MNQDRIITATGGGSDNSSTSISSSSTLITLSYLPSTLSRSTPLFSAISKCCIMSAADRFPPTVPPTVLKAEEEEEGILD